MTAFTIWSIKKVLTDLCPAVHEGKPVPYPSFKLDPETQALMRRFRGSKGYSGLVEDAVSQLRPLVGTEDLKRASEAVRSRRRGTREPRHCINASETSLDHLRAEAEKAGLRPARVLEAYLFIYLWAMERGGANRIG